MWLRVGSMNMVFVTAISQNFFPQYDAFVSLINVYAVFAIGYLIRPLGGILFAHFGDKNGRKKPFVFSVMLMTGATCLVGFLPTYQDVGIASSILLILLRLLQGLSIGGEIPGTFTFACEHVNPQHRGLTCSMIFAFFNVGILLASLMNGMLNALLSPEQLLSWGWRIPFIFGGSLGSISFYLRKKMTESPLFISFLTAKTTHIPLIETLTKHWPKIIQGILLTWLGAVVINLLFLYLPTYLTTILSYSRQQAALFALINLLIYTAVHIGISWLSDHIGRRSILLAGSLGFVLFSYLLFSELAQPRWVHLFIATFIITILSGCITLYACMLVELFPTSIRFTGIAISYNVGFAIFGGLTPLIVTSLIHLTGNLLAPSYYLMLSALLCLIAATTIKNRHQVALD